MSKRDNWYVITGAPSSGKSTIINRLSEMGYKTFQEVARQLIDEELASGKTLEEIEIDSPKFDEKVAQLQYKLEKKLDQSEKIFFDRGIHDALGFFEHYGWPKSPMIEKYCTLARYHPTVFLLELLEYEKDYARVETEDTARSLQEKHHKTYKAAGYNVIIIPKGSVENRLKLILDYIN